MRTRQISPYFDIVDTDDGSQHMVVYLKGIALLRLVLTNKGTAFTLDERAALGIEGLLPPAVNTLEQQVERVYAGYQLLARPIDKYQMLRALQERHEILFYALLKAHLEEMMPIVYTPTVGEAVQRFDALYQNPRGLSLSPHNIERAYYVAANYPMDDVRMIVVTDSSAILGIGDQGYGGLAIPIGKLALYTVGGGVSPFHTMPVALDVGTARQDLREHRFYLGERRERLDGEAYYDFVDRFVAMVKTRWPRAVIQWEDLAKEKAFAVLERYRDDLPSFNDDIQGTGAVALSGVVSACRMLGQRLVDQTIVVHGAGAGGIGVAWAFRQAMQAAGLSEDEARARVLVLDSQGLLVRGRPMKSYKEAFAQDRERWPGAGAPDLLTTVKHFKATALMGLSGQPGAFTEAVVRATAANTDRPIIFPLSNPTASSEAVPNDIFAWTEGRGVVATGSPFDPVEWQGELHPIGQGNNAFIFPGLGLGAILANATRVTDSMVLAASFALSDYTAATHLHVGRIYPPITELDAVSCRVAERVIRQAVDDGVADLPPGAAGDLEGYVQSHFWTPHYLPFVAGERRALD